MSEEQKNPNIKTVRLMESFITYENHGDISLNLDIFPELKDKNNAEIQAWLNKNVENLYIDSYSGELRKNQQYLYSQEELDEMLVNGEEPEIDEDVIELYEYWNDTSVIWDKIKCEEKTLHLI